MRFGEKLIQAGLINQAQLDAGLSHQQQTSQRIGEALLELGYISESTLLRYLALEFNTKFVSTDRLAKVAIGSDLLDMLPFELADKNQLFPILFDKEKRILGIVSHEPQNQSAIEEARIISGAKQVQVFVARREAIRALIKKHYRGDLRAFDTIEPAPRESETTLECDRVTDEPIASEVVPKPQTQPAVIHAVNEGTSTWSKEIEAVRGRSLLSDNDFIEALNILVGLVEMNTRNRKGHSSRVARLVKLISEKSGLRELEIDHNIIAAYLHDLGKRSDAHLTLLNIADSDLHRRRAQRYHMTPARLFDSVHLPIRVNGIVTHLYERFDGAGLPESQAGDAIPLGARIIALVDAYEDLLNNPDNYLGRTLPSAEALSKIEAAAGSLFDPQLVDCFNRVLTAESDSLKSSGLRILVADPDPRATEELEKKLSEDGFQVRVARNSQDALESIKEENLAAAIVEVQLVPDGGFLILERVKRLPSPFAVVLVTTEPTPEMFNRALEDGALGLVAKPFQSGAILERLAGMLAKSSFSQDTGDPVTKPIAIEKDTAENIDPLYPLPPESKSRPGGSKGKAEVGTLEEGKTVFMLIRSLVANRRSGLLLLRDGDNKGEIYFKQGHIFGASSGTLNREEAFLKLAIWKGCVYQFDPDVEPRERTVKTPTVMLLKIAAPLSIE